MLQSDIEIEGTRISLKASAESLRPSLSVYASLQNTALAGEVNELRAADSGIDPFFIGGYGTALGQLVRRNFPNYSFGFNLQIPLRNRTARANYAIDSLQLRQQELNRRRQVNSLRVEVENALVAVEQARIRYEAAVEERALREQVLDAEEKRYALGVSQAFFVIQYQTELVVAQSAEVAALSEFVKAKVDLDQVTGQTLEAFHISIDEAREGRMAAPPSPLPAEEL
jgi:outer membrane protein TolC